MGAILGCRDVCLAMASALSVGRNPFNRVEMPRRRNNYEPDEKQAIEDMKTEQILKERGKYHKLVGNSDHALLAALLARFMVKRETVARRKFCDGLGLNFNCMREMIQLYNQLDSALVAAGFTSDRKTNRNGKSWRIVHACATAAMAPSQLVKLRRPGMKYDQTAEGATERDGKAQELKFFVRTGTTPQPESDDRFENEERVFIHPASANFSAGNYGFPFLVFHSLVRTSKPFLRDVTEASAYALLLFGGSIDVESAKKSITVDGWAELSAHPRIGALVGGLRKRVDHLLRKKVENPSQEISSTAEMRLIAKLIATDGLAK